MHNWGKVQIGDEVTSAGRHGIGQPKITGKLVRIDRRTNTGVIQPNDGSDERRRSLSNLRPTASPVAQEHNRRAGQARFAR